ncbi:hypothetical protein C0J52_03269 [Blattella germanica]|nr:hypothetical protein C0J52_03269 [Blattella germanica]
MSKHTLAMKFLIPMCLSILVLAVAQIEEVDVLKNRNLYFPLIHPQAKNDSQPCPPGKRGFGGICRKVYHSNQSRVPGVSHNPREDGDQVR